MGKTEGWKYFCFPTWNLVEFVEVWFYLYSFQTLLKRGFYLLLKLLRLCLENGVVWWSQGWSVQYNMEKSEKYAIVFRYFCIAHIYHFFTQTLFALLHSKHNICINTWEAKNGHYNTIWRILKILQLICSFCHTPMHWWWWWL